PSGRHPALVRQQDRQRPDRGHQQPGAGRQSKGTRLSINSKPQGHGLPAGRQARPAAARITTFPPTPNGEEPKKQQMRWSRTTVQPFLEVRTAVLNDTLADAFRHHYPGFRPVNDDEATAAAA